MKICLEKPYYLVIYSVLGSFICWFFPSFNILRSGFEKRINFLSSEILGVIFVYLFFIIALFCGYHAVKSKKIKTTCTIDDNKVYFMFFLIGSLGVLFTYKDIFKIISLSDIKNLINLGQANYLREITYLEYSVGFKSLRYIVGPTFSLMLIRRIIYEKKNIYVDSLVIIELFLVVLIAARLIFIYSIFSFLLFYNFKYKKIKFNLKKLLVVFGIFIILSFFNYSRNKNFYQNNFNQGIIVAGVSEIKTYLGSPFQGSLQVMKYYLEDKNESLETFYKDSTIERGLTTNSAIFDFYFFYNIKNFFVLLICSISGGFVLGVIIKVIRNFKYTPLFITYSTILYQILELWRGFFLGAGIFIVLEVIPIIVTIICSLIIKGEKNEKR